MSFLRPKLLFLAVFILILNVIPVKGGVANFVIYGADNLKNLSVNTSSELNTLVSNIEPRFVMEFANANKFYTLTPIPSQLDTLLGQVAPRFVLQYANTSREITLGFPVDLVDDTTPPQGSNIEAEPAGETSTTVSWTTDEYADSTVECGTQSGTYTMTFSDPLYARVHAVTLTGLTAGTTYYCQVTSTDLSGNPYQSQEFSFEQVEDVFIYLPLVLRS